MKRTDIIMVILVSVAFVFVFRYQITGFFGYGGLGFFETDGMGRFRDTGNDICTEDGKPIVYFFGSDGCRHCMWEKPIFDKAVSEFEGYISLHDNMNTQNDEDVEVEYGGGSPLIIIGCKFARRGSGENWGAAAEEMILRNLICKVADSPVCG
jgi:thiol-disulfide isomerase/thioredoxin